MGDKNVRALYITMEERQKGRCYYMSYSQLLKYSDNLDHSLRLIDYARYYSRLELEGLHYVTFIKESNILSISCPDHSTHHLATSYLIVKSSEYPINTVKGRANDLKKFLDFLMLWDIDPGDVDLLRTLEAFTDYLRNIRLEKVKKHSIEWSMATEVPLHTQASTKGKVVSIGYDNAGFKHVKNWHELSYSTISQTVGTAVQYLFFLKERTRQYQALPLNLLPVTSKYNKSILSGTLGKKQQTYVDIRAILSRVGLKAPVIKKNMILRQKVFKPDEFEFFMNAIPTHHRQNRLLFYVLGWFGLRASEAANIMIDTTTIPKNLVFMEFHEVREYIKKNLRGDIEFSQHIEQWVCSVVERDNEHYRAQHKSGSREVPLLFSEEYFLDLLVEALLERELLMQYATETHSYLFVSLRKRGNPITGASVGEKFTNLVNKINKKYKRDFKTFSPHSFRHFFATYLLRIKRKSISDVSRWLGHANEEITRDTYSHYLPNKKDIEKEVVKDMIHTFARKDD
ncbi:tyrosine-type recombinase/integrase [Anaerosolibacter sp.]|uniref:tyrosine-type recombinase/integrase n=1 Tax=Anaerosolibacter sp. TaxID=1872527 RepID=UPI0039F0BFDF